MSASSNEKQWFPLAGGATDGWSTDKEATATCFCGAIQLVFPTQEPGLIQTFVCNCSDCHKLSAAQYESNFIVDDKYVRYVRGRDNIKEFSQSKTIASKNTMTNQFCATCGTLLNRISSGFPGKSILRIGTVDDFRVQETILKPRVEQYTKHRLNWVHPIDGVRQVDGSSF